MDVTSELSRRLKQYLPWNKCRIRCFAGMIIALLTVRTVNLTEWAQVFDTCARPDSAYMRIKRFFRHFSFDENTLAKFIFHLFDLQKGKWYLTLDRTNWELGNFKINFLVLAVAYKSVAIPLMWSLLDKKGNSNCAERVTLMQRFTSCFGTEVIAGMLADREFVGKPWFSYLSNAKIPFFIRIKWNFLVSNSRGEMVNAWQLFTGLKPGEKRVLKGKRKIHGLELNLAGVKCDDGDFLIVATTEEGENAIETYRHRWQIETLFGCLKSKGFNLEDTHITRPDRLGRLMAVLAVAFCWAHKIGEWENQVTPIKIKKHGRKEMGLFRKGLNVLTRVFCVRCIPRKEIFRAVDRLFALPVSFQCAQPEVSS